MSKPRLWLLAFFTPYVVITAMLLLTFFARPQENISLYNIVFACTPFALVTWLTIYIVATKYFLQVNRKIIMLTTLIVFIGASSATLWLTVFYLHPQFTNSVSLDAQRINFVYQNREYNDYIYSWTQYFKDSRKHKLHTIRSSDQEDASITTEISPLNIRQNLIHKDNHILQPFLIRLFYNARHSTQRPFAIVLFISIMLGCIYTGMSIASLWTANIFLQGIFLINAHGILNITLNMLITYPWLLIGFMALLIAVFTTFVLFRMYYDIDNEVKTENENASQKYGTTQ